MISPTPEPSRHPTSPLTAMPESSGLQRALVGCLLGTAVGDALGLPLEGLSKSRQAKMFPDLDRYHFLPGKGMVSDDTQHQCIVAQALIKSHGTPEAFSKDIAWRLRFWLLGIPAGVGRATLRAVIKLWLGWPPHKSGVFSAGNGPAMRSAVLGICYGGQPETLKQLIAVCTRLTHTDPKAEYGALAVALAAYCAKKGITDPQIYFQSLRETVTGNSEFFDLMQTVANSVQKKETTEHYAENLGLEKGVTGYMYHTLPVVLHAWLSHPQNFKMALQAVIRCGGDSDTTGAILGSIAGAGAGKEGIPEKWLHHLCEWPQTVGWMERLGTQLAESLTHGKNLNPPSVPFAFSFLRNLFFTGVVLLHGFRRMLPPY